MVEPTPTGDAPQQDAGATVLRAVIITIIVTVFGGLIWLAASTSGDDPNEDGYPVNQPPSGWINSPVT